MGQWHGEKWLIYKRSINKDSSITRYMKKMEDTINASWILSPGKLKNGGERKVLGEKMTTLRWDIDSKGTQDIHFERIQCLEREEGWNFREARSVCEIGKMSWHFSREGPLRWLEWAWPGGGSIASPMAGDREPGQGVTVWTEPLAMHTFGGRKN